MRGTHIGYLPSVERGLKNGERTHNICIMISVYYYYYCYYRYIRQTVVVVATRELNASEGAEAADANTESNSTGTRQILGKWRFSAAEGASWPQNYADRHSNTHTHSYNARGKTRPNARSAFGRNCELIYLTRQDNKQRPLQRI